MPPAKALRLFHPASQVKADLVRSGRRRKAHTMQSVLRNRQPKNKASAKPKVARFPLLIYHRYHQVQRGLSLRLVMLGIVLAISAVLLHTIRPGAVSGDVWL